MDLSQFNDRGKIRLSRLLLVGIALKFLYNAIKLFLEGEMLYAGIYLLLTIILLAWGFWFLKKATNKLLLLCVMCGIGAKPLLAQNQASAKKPLPTLTDTIKMQGKEYLDTIYLGTTKTAFIDVKGFDFLSGDLGSGNNGIIKMAVQEKSHVLKLHATAPFAETNLFLINEDTVLQFLIRYRANPAKNYYNYYLPIFKANSAAYQDSVKLANVLSSNISLLDSLIKARTASDKTPGVSSKTSTENGIDYTSDYELVKTQEKNISKGQVFKGKRIEAQKLYVIGKRMFIGILVQNQWKGSFQISDISTELIHTTKGNKSIIDADIEVTAFTNVNAFSKNEFVIDFPNFQSEYGDKLVITVKPEKENNLPDYKIEINNRDFNLLKFISKAKIDAKKK